VHAQRLQGEHVDLLITLLKLPCVKSLTVFAKGKAVPAGQALPIEQMDAVGQFIQQNPALRGAHPLEELRMYFVSGKHQSRRIAGHWPMLLLQHLGMAARKVRLHGFGLNTVSVRTDMSAWATVFTLLSTATHGPAQLTVAGDALEGSAFLRGVTFAEKKGLLLSCSINVEADWDTTRVSFLSVAPLVKLTTGTLTIRGRWCDSKTLAEMKASIDANKAKISLLYIIGRLPQPTTELVQALKRFNEKSREPRRLGSARAVLNIVVGRRMNYAERQVLLVRISNLPEEIADRVAQYFDFKQLLNAAQTSRTNNALVQGQIAKALQPPPKKQ
jgi:hypothetical protein